MLNADEAPVTARQPPGPVGSTLSAALRPARPKTEFKLALKISSLVPSALLISAKTSGLKLFFLI